MRTITYHPVHHKIILCIITILPLYVSWLINGQFKEFYASNYLKIEVYVDVSVQVRTYVYEPIRDFLQ